MADEIVGALGTKQVVIKHYVVVKLLILSLGKVIDDRHLRWIVLYHELSGHRWHEGPTEGQCRQVYKL